MGSGMGETDELLQKLALKQRRDAWRRRAGGLLPARGRRRARVHRGQPLFHPREQDVLELRHVLRHGACALRSARSCSREVLGFARGVRNGDVGYKRRGGKGEQQGAGVGG